MDHHLPLGCQEIRQLEQQCLFVVHSFLNSPLLLLLPHLIGLIALLTNDHLPPIAAASFFDPLSGLVVEINVPGRAPPQRVHLVL